MFIVFEGIDGCGKSTQARMLYEYLSTEGHNVLLTAEPTKNVIGSCVREILASGEEIDPRALALLFTADRYEHIEKEILPALAANRIVVSERYYYSTVAYQAAQGVDFEWLKKINDLAMGKQPDIVFLLDVGPDFALPKIHEKDNKFLERLEHLKKRVEELRKQYLNKRKMLQGRFNTKKAAGVVVAMSRELECAEEEYQKEKSKYLKFRRFERPTTLEAEADKYDVFLGRVRANYLMFDGLTVLDGTRPANEVFEDVKKKVSIRLGL
jgi:dTMP kinase